MSCVKNECFIVHPLAPEKAKTYWKTIRKRGLTESYAGDPLLIGHPKELPLAFVEQVSAGARASHEVILDAIRASGGITPFMQDRTISFGPQILNDPDINVQLEVRLAAGYGLPLMYDVLVTRDEEKYGVKVIELQTAGDYERDLSEQLEAAGYNPHALGARFGEEAPDVWYASFSQRFAEGEPIVVMDTDPFDLTRVAKIGMQQLVGREGDLPISPLDILGKDEKGYYYHPYVVDTNRPFDVKRDESGNPIKDTSRSLYAMHVMARMDQSDLNLLWRKVEGDPEKTALVTQFLTDSKVNWIWYPAWHHLGDKTMLSVIRKKLLEAGDPLAEQFVPVYRAGEEVAVPGKYIIKPSGGHSGEAQSEAYVEDSDTIVVEEGAIYQQKISPAPVLSYLPGRLTAAMRRTSQEDLRTRDKNAGDAPRPVTGQLEIRCLVMPYWKGQIAGRYMTRHAPRWEDPEILRQTKTNATAIHRSVYSHLEQNEGTRDEYELYPYGVAPAVVVFDVKSKRIVH